MSSSLPSVATAVTRIGRGAAVWALPGEYEIGDAHWIAITGIPHPDFNLAWCHGVGGDLVLEHYLDRLIRHRRPGLLTTTTDLGSPVVLRERGWRPVGSAPVMAAQLTDVLSHGQHPPGESPDVIVAEELEQDQLREARELIGRVFTLDDTAAEVALRPDAAHVDRHVWGVRDGTTLSAGAITVIDGEFVTVWSMGSDPRVRRRGEAITLLRTALAHAAAAGCTTAVLNSTPMAESFYAAAGFTVLDRVTYWSNPRWVLSAD